MRVAVYTDYAYHLVGGQVHAERAFALFLARLARSFDGFVVIGRLSPGPSRARYPLGAEVDYVPLPWYESLASPRSALPAMASSSNRFWQALEEVDCVWLLGPHPLAIVFAVLALARRRRVVLGVRQDIVGYVRSRHPARPALALAARVLEGCWALLARICPVVVVGPRLAQRYNGARRVLEIAVSLVDEADLVTPAVAGRRSYEGELRVLSVGRLEPEKNPLLLADILAHLNRPDAAGHGWRLIVCGEGPMADQLRRRAADLGVADRLDLRGYVPFGEPLLALYRGVHAFLHVSLTEGYPQVLLEAFAAGVPVVATDVGGVVEAAGEAVLPVPPADAPAAAGALGRLAADPKLRARLIAAGHAYARGHSAALEVDRVAEFLHGA